MGQSAHPVLRLRRGCALLAAAALAGPMLTGCGSSVAQATTTLVAAADVTVLHSDGTTSTGVAGLKLRPTDVVRTGPAGRADLVTRDRHVYLGSVASLQVVDGAHQGLRRGAVVVDAQDGPGLRLDVAGLQVTTPGGSAVRAERSVTVRVAALAGRADVVSATGRELTVPGLRQVVTGGDALPDTTAPLRLTDDAGEAAAVPDLVRDDRSLLALARGIDGTDAGSAGMVTVSWSRRVTPTPAGVARSERVLPIAIAAAGREGDPMTRYRSVVDNRVAGGSWAVVARLVGVPATAVVDQLALFGRTEPAGRVGNVRQILADLGATGSDGGTSADGSHDGTGDGGNHGGDGSGSTPSGSPSPSPSPGAGDQVTDTVDDTVGQVLSLVPTPTPTPSGVLPTSLTSLPAPPLGH